MNARTHAHCACFMYNTIRVFNIYVYMYGSYILYTYTSPRCFAHFAAWRVHQNKRANVAHSLCQPHARTHATPAEFTPLCPRPATHTRTHVHTKCAKTPTPCSIDTRGSTRTTRQSTLANAHARERPRRTRTDRTHAHTHTRRVNVRYDNTHHTRIRQQQRLA